jgi:hypothetical protein
MRCSPQFICDLIGEMKDEMRDRVTAMGFGELLEFKMDTLSDRVLGMFLTSCVKEDPLRLEVGGKQLLITREAVNQVLGIPLGNNPVPTWNYNQCKAARAELRRICEEKGLREKYGPDRQAQYENLGPSEVPRWFIQEAATAKHRDIDDWAVQSFFMLIFNALLFSTGTDKLVGLDYLMAKDLDLIPHLDWCQAVVDDIRTKAKAWNQSIAANSKSTPIVQGCIAFLLVRSIS